jgi:hypothetical protein
MATALAKGFPPNVLQRILKHVNKCKANSNRLLSTGQISYKNNKMTMHSFETRLELREETTGKHSDKVGTFQSSSRSQKQQQSSHS